MAPSRKRNFQITMETKPNAKRRRLNGRRGGGKKDKTPTPYHAPVKTEPTVVTDIKVKPEMDALVLPDVKPDVKTLDNDNTGESFATRIEKGSGWILIDEYSTPKSPDRNGTKPGQRRTGTKFKSDKIPE
jgi:hypothetical protein